MEGKGQPGPSAPGPLWSHLAGWDDLLVPVPSTDASGLDLEEGWPDRWLVTRRVDGNEVLCTVRDLARMPGEQGGPVRWFSWRRAQRHRPALRVALPARPLPSLGSGTINTSSRLAEAAI